MYKIFITGGHLTPALAIIQKIIDERLPYSIVFIGRKYAMEDDTVPSQEYRIIKSNHIRFFALTTGRFRRFLSFKSLSSLLKIPIGFIQSFIFCIREKPNLIISFGGYIAVPVVIAGWCLRIPSITHEQSFKLGLANKIISYFVKKICYSWPDITHIFPKNKSVYTGIPLRREIFYPSKETSFKKTLQHPLIYILGGATGSKTINFLVLPIIQRLVNHFVIIHQLGDRWIQHGISTRSNLSLNDREKYIPLAYLNANDHSWALHNSNLIISRSGANIVAEIDVAGKIAIFLPISWSGGEQVENAKYLEKKGSAYVVNTDTVTSDLLYETILTIYKKNKDRRILSYNSPLQSGTENFMQEINNLISES